MFRNVYAVNLGAVLVLLTLFGCSRSAGEHEINHAVPYKILSDDMGTVIQIGVDSNIDEIQLCDTLAKAADDHQDDPARDYVTSSFLSIDAHRLKNEEKSTVSAGLLKRYVPWKNSEQRKKISGDRSTWDQVTVTLDQTRRTMR